MLLLAFFATVTQDAENDEDLYGLLKNPSLFANIKFDLDSVKASFCINDFLLL